MDFPMGAEMRNVSERALQRDGQEGRLLLKRPIHDQDDPWQLES